MFSNETLDFLTALARNNRRDWFEANRAWYEAAVKDPAKGLAARLNAGIESFTGLAHRPRIFRIHRDVRFSKYKTLYNSHVHMSFVPQDGGDPPPAWMMGLSPDCFTLGCGLFAFGKSDLAAWREEVCSERGEGIARLRADARADRIRLSPPELKRVPAPHAGDHPRADLLRHKGIVGWIDGDGPQDGLGPDAHRRALDAFARLRPLFDALWELQGRRC